MKSQRDTGSRRPSGPRSPSSQRGGFGMGVVVGLLIGLALALGVALYIAKVPVPFVDKVPHRSAEQEAAENERLKSWDPNAPLAGKQAPRPTMAPATPASEPAEASTLPVSPPAATPPVAAASTPARAASRPAAASGNAEAVVRSTRDPAAILSGQVAAVTPAAPRGGDPFVYFVQVGAYSNPDDAEAQRAKLAMQGLAAKLTEREQSGRVVHRVRLGPFDSREEAESQQERVRSLGSEAALVRVDRNAR